MAQGRFRAYFWLAVAAAGTFLPAISAGSWWRAEVGAAAAVSLHLWVFSVTGLRLSIGPGGGRLADVWRVYAAPTGVGAVAVTAGVLLGRTLPAMPGRDWAQLAVIGVVAVAIYVPLIVLLAPEACAELRWRVTSLLGTRLAGNAAVRRLMGRAGARAKAGA
jgi:hypothetical protein